MNIASLLSSKSGILSLLTGVSFLLTTVAPLIPSPWGALVTSILGVLSFYHIGQTVSSARQAGVKGI